MRDNIACSDSREAFFTSEDMSEVDSHIGVPTLWGEVERSKNHLFCRMLMLPHGEFEPRFIHMNIHKFIHNFRQIKTNFFLKLECSIFLTKEAEEQVASVAQVNKCDLDSVLIVVIKHVRVYFLPPDCEKSIT